MRKNRLPAGPGEKAGLRFTPTLHHRKAVNSIWAGTSRCAGAVLNKSRFGETWEMAVANDSTYDTLKRAPSYSGSYTVSLSGDSTFSIEDLGSVDIGEPSSFVLRPSLSVNIVSSYP